MESGGYDHLEPLAGETLTWSMVSRRFQQANATMKTKDKVESGETLMLSMVSEDSGSYMPEGQGGEWRNLNVVDVAEDSGSYMPP